MRKPVMKKLIPYKFKKIQTAKIFILKAMETYLFML